MHKTNAFTLLKCIVFSVLWTCYRGKKSPKSQFYGASGWLVRCSCSGKRQKPSGSVGESPLRGCTCLKCTNVLYGVEMLRW